MPRRRAPLSAGRTIVFQRRWFPRVSFSAGGFPRVGGGVDEEAIGIALKIDEIDGLFVEIDGVLVVVFFMDIVEEMALIPYYANDTFVSVSVTCYIGAQ
jgi:hypothetical protein